MEIEKGGYDKAHAWTGIKVSTLYTLVRQSRIPHHRAGPKLVVFVKQEIDAWLASNAVPVATSPVPN